MFKRDSLARGNSLRDSSQDEETCRKLVRLVSRIDQRVHGVSQAEDQDFQVRKQLIGKLTRLVLNDQDKKKLMDELCIGSDDAYESVGASARETVENQ